VKGEEGLFAAIEAKCESANYLDSARLTFFQKLQIVRALYMTPPVNKAQGCDAVVEEAPRHQQGRSGIALKQKASSAT
jgi:hypothetical protein